MGILSWFTSRKTNQQQLKEQLEQLQAQVAQLESQHAEATTQLQFYRERDAVDQEKRNSPEPWVEIKSADYSEVKGFHIELDWNDAFIQYLKDNGIRGVSEEAAVQKWLAFLYNDLVGKLEEAAVNKTENKLHNDFE